MSNLYLINTFWIFLLKHILIKTFDNIYNETYDITLFHRLQYKRNFDFNFTNLSNLSNLSKHTIQEKIDRRNNKKCVRRVRILLPFLFDIYSETILKKSLNEKIGVITRNGINMLLIFALSCWRCRCFSLQSS